jgi:hypothetical protein
VSQRQRQHELRLGDLVGLGRAAGQRRQQGERPLAQERGIGRGVGQAEERLVRAQRQAIGEAQVDDRAVGPGYRGLAHFAPLRIDVAHGNRDRPRGGGDRRRGVGELGKLRAAEDEAPARAEGLAPLRRRRLEPGRRLRRGVHALAREQRQVRKRRHAERRALVGDRQRLRGVDRAERHRHLRERAAVLHEGSRGGDQPSALARLDQTARRRARHERADGDGGEAVDHRPGRTILRHGPGGRRREPQAMEILAGEPGPPRLGARRAGSAVVHLHSGLADRAELGSELEVRPRQQRVDLVAVGAPLALGARHRRAALPAHGIAAVVPAGDARLGELRAYAGADHCLHQVPPLGSQAQEHLERGPLEGQPRVGALAPAPPAHQRAHRQALGGPPERELGVELRRIARPRDVERGVDHAQGLGVPRGVGSERSVDAREVVDGALVGTAGHVWLLPAPGQGVSAARYPPFATRFPPANGV